VHGDDRKPNGGGGRPGPRPDDVEHHEPNPKSKRAAARKARRPSGGARISAYFKLSRVMSKASFATTVEPHQLDTKPAGLAFDTWLGLNEDVCELV
jgi:hypothetical protein